MMTGSAFVDCRYQPAMLRRNTGLIERLDVGGLPLGIKPDAIYETETATLETGDWLVVFTDAVVEAVNEPGGLRRRTSDLNPQRQCENIARPASWLISTSSLETRRTMTSPVC